MVKMLIIIDSVLLNAGDMLLFYYFFGDLITFHDSSKFTKTPFGNWFGFNQQIALSP